MPGRTTCCGTTARGLRLLPTPGKGRFALPVQQPRSTGLGRSSGDYHSFTYGPLHIVALPERYIDLTAGSYFQRWLDADLRQAAADPTIKWRITFGHRPFFSTGRPASRRGSFVRRVGPAGTGEISRRHRVQRARARIRADPADAGWDSTTQEQREMDAGASARHMWLLVAVVRRYTTTSVRRSPGTRSAGSGTSTSAWTSTSTDARSG
jgi:hypothetical protein